MLAIKEYYQEFIQDVLTKAESDQTLHSKSFFEKVSEDLIEIGDLSADFEYCEYTHRGIQIDGYDFDSESNTLILIIQEFYNTTDDKIPTITKDTIETKFKRLLNFYKQSSKQFYKLLDESTQEYLIAYKILDLLRKEKINKVRLILVSNGVKTSNLDTISDIYEDGMVFEHKIYDIEYFYHNYLLLNDTGSFSVNLSVPCLEIPQQSTDYNSYLAVLDGETIANIYAQYGKKLLDSNVRTFLQFRGSVNKGLKNTIETAPEKFFAYNNGITATASSVEIVDNKLVSITDFQIVNGGQTTSAIYAASINKNKKVDLSRISVQMKLSVVVDEDANRKAEFINDISRYANTQNKVNESDLFSNSIFHKEFKKYSNKVFVPTLNGKQYQTKWYYERVRGEYLQEISVLKTNSEKEKFKKQNPKDQFVDKTFIAKSENVWLKKPDIVSKGAQYSFKSFADYISEKLVNNPQLVNELYFKDVVARAIIFKKLEKNIFEASWYEGGYRAQIVAYTLAYFANFLEKTKLNLDFNLIWNLQTIPESLANLLNYIGEEVYRSLKNPPAGNANIAQWAKKNQCWKVIQQLDLNVAEHISKEYLISKEIYQSEQKSATKEKKYDDNVAKEVLLMKMPHEFWIDLHTYYTRSDISGYNLNKKQLDILFKKSKDVYFFPTDKQWMVLVDLYEKAKEDGVNFEKYENAIV